MAANPEQRKMYGSCSKKQGKLEPHTRNMRQKSSNNNLLTVGVCEICYKGRTTLPLTLLSNGNNGSTLPYPEKLIPKDVSASNGDDDHDDNDATTTTAMGHGDDNNDVSSDSNDEENDIDENRPRETCSSFDFCPIETCLGRCL